MIAKNENNTPQHYLNTQHFPHSRTISCLLSILNTTPKTTTTQYFLIHYLSTMAYAIGDTVYYKKDGGKPPSSPLISLDTTTN